jgi:hypothetical protein
MQVKGQALGALASGVTELGRRCTYKLKSEKGLVWQKFILDGYDRNKLCNQLL